MCVGYADTGGPREADSTKEDQPWPRQAGIRRLGFSAVLQSSVCEKDKWYALLQHISSQVALFAKNEKVKTQKASKFTGRTLTSV